MEARVLDVDLEVVLEVLADGRQVVHDVDPQSPQLAGVTDPRELEDLRRVDRAAAEDDLVRVDSLDLATVHGLDADRPCPVEEHAVTIVRVRTSRFPRLRMIGCRYARAALSRRPR